MLTTWMTLSTRRVRTPSEPSPACRAASPGGPAARWRLAPAAEGGGLALLGGFLWLFRSGSSVSNSFVVAEDSVVLYSAVSLMMARVQTQLVVTGSWRKCKGALGKATVLVLLMRVSSELIIRRSVHTHIVGDASAAPLVGWGAVPGSASPLLGWSMAAAAVRAQAGPRPPPAVSWALAALGGACVLLSAQWLLSGMHAADGRGSADLVHRVYLPRVVWAFALGGWTCLARARVASKAGATLRGALATAALATLASCRFGPALLAMAAHAALLSDLCATAPSNASHGAGARPCPDVGATGAFAAAVEWWLAASHYFFATGHQCVANALHAQAGLVGVKEFSFWASGTLLFLETATPWLIFAAFAPLLAHELSSGNASGRAHVGNVIAGACAGLHAAQVLGSAAACLKLRRHLMLWGVFAPKFLFDAALATTTAVLSLAMGEALGSRTKPAD